MNRDFGYPVLAAFLKHVSLIFQEVNKHHSVREIQHLWSVTSYPAVLCFGVCLGFFLLGKSYFKIMQERSNSTRLKAAVDKYLNMRSERWEYYRLSLAIHDIEREAKNWNGDSCVLFLYVTFYTLSLAT